MALQFSPSVQNLFIGRGLLSGIAAGASVSVYSGAQPTSAQIAASWSTYASTNSIFLAHYTAITWSQPSNGIMMTISTFPAAVNALNSGTATWAIVWTSAVTGVNVAAGTLPSTNFMVVPASNSIGDGVIRFSDPVFTSGVSKAILDGSVGATF